MIGDRVSHYQIIEEIGGGGMGVLYRAEDTRLGRQVALKFLPPQLSHDKSAKARFMHEARAASALQHHNICTIHDIDETPDGRLFISMDCYEGESLGAVAARGPLPADEAVDLVLQIAQGLGRAHEAEIVHRDIKPDNLLLTNDGVVKIVDFGLAKLAGSTKITQQGITVGTPAYMSPEQASGSDIDHRADIWAMGVVFYELLTGVSPFDRGPATFYAIENLEPQPIANYRDDVSARLIHIIDRCIAKDPADRYQSTGEFIVDLETYRRSRRRFNPAPWLLAAVLVATAILTYRGWESRMPRITASFDRPKIAVLPFRNLGRPDVEYFADGMTDEVSVRLAGISGLGVISRTSTMQYKRSELSLHEIADELDADFVVEGAVRWDSPAGALGGRVRVTPQLIRVAGDSTIWASAYEVELDSVFAVQSDIAMRVVSALTVPLLDSERDFMQQPPTHNVEAFDAYLRGRALAGLYQHGERDFRAVIEQYERAIGYDSTFVAALARASRSYIDWYWHHERVEEYLERSRRLLAQAERHGPDHPLVLETEASAYLHQGDYDRAFELLAELDRRRPNDPDVLREIAFVYTRQDRWDDAIELLQRAVELNPRSREVAYFLANRCVKAGRYDEAYLYYDRLIDIAGSDDVGEYYALKCWIPVIDRGDLKAARRMAAECPERSADNPFLVHTRAWIAALDRDYRGAIALFETRLRYMAGIPTHNPGQSYYNRAMLYGLLGEGERAHALYDSARVYYEAALEVSSSEFTNAGMGIACAGLGERERAIEYGLKAVTYAEGNPWFEPVVRGWLARIYTMTGDHDLAIEQLEWVLESTSDITVPLLRMDPTWDALREEPGFKKLVSR